jgi:AcrR family transcriptional regulator
LVVAQVKKAAVRQAIIDSAFRLFSAKGYSNATLSEIAAGADVSPANVYVYFTSKLDVLFAIYDPWLRDRLTRLETELARMPEPGDRLRHIFTTLWRGIPAESNGFANNIIQALSTATPEEGYEPVLLRWLMSRLAAMIADCLTPAQREKVDVEALAHLALMAFDGFSLNVHLHGKPTCGDAVIDLICGFLGRPGQKRPVLAASRKSGRLIKTG